jgi:hypothetical protein
MYWSKHSARLGAPYAALVGAPGGARTAPEDARTAPEDARIAHGGALGSMMSPGIADCIRYKSTLLLLPDRESFLTIFQRYLSLQAPPCYLSFQDTS